MIDNYLIKDSIENSKDGDLQRNKYQGLLTIFLVVRNCQLRVSSDVCLVAFADQWIFGCLYLLFLEDFASLEETNRCVAA
jgi:hypothetical protein